MEEGSPIKIDYGNKGALILTSLLEDLVAKPQPEGKVFACAVAQTTGKGTPHRMGLVFHGSHGREHAPYWGYLPSAQAPIRFPESRKFRSTFHKLDHGEAEVATALQTAVNLNVSGYRSHCCAVPELGLKCGSLREFGLPCFSGLTQSLGTFSGQSRK